MLQACHQRVCSRSNNQHCSGTSACSYAASWQGPHCPTEAQQPAAQPHLAQTNSCWHNVMFGWAGLLICLDCCCCCSALTPALLICGAGSTQQSIRPHALHNCHAFSAPAISNATVCAQARLPTCAYSSGASPAGQAVTDCTTHSGRPAWLRPMSDGLDWRGGGGGRQKRVLMSMAWFRKQHLTGMPPTAVVCHQPRNLHPPARTRVQHADTQCMIKTKPAEAAAARMSQ